MKRRVAVRGIFISDGRLLCIKLKPYLAKKVDYWCVVGGGVDPGESLIKALEREIIEETAVKPIIGRLLYVQQFMNSNRGEEQMELFFKIDNPEDFTSVDLSKTTHGQEEIESIAYIDPSDAKYNVLPEFLRAMDLTNLPETTVFFDYM